MGIISKNKINDRIFINIDGKIYPPMAVTITNRRGDKFQIDKDYVRELGKAGIKIFFVMTDTNWCDNKSIALFKKECETILSVVPDAFFVVRIGLQPPFGWEKDNKEECFTYSNGEIRSVNMASYTCGGKYEGLYTFTSDKWKEDAGRALLKTIDEYEKLTFFDRIIGYFFCAGATSEWHSLLLYESGDLYGDISEPTRKKFIEYLKSEYKTIDNLRKAWNKPNLTFEEIKVPGRKERYYTHEYDEVLWDKNTYCSHDEKMHGNGTNIGSFVDINTHRDIVDYYRFIHINTSNTQIYFANLVKERYKGNILTGAFYGSYGCTDFFNNGTAGGVRNLLLSGKIDLLSSPGVYVNRQPGGFEGQRCIEDSYKLHDCIFFAEQDTRTHLEELHYRNLFDYYDIEDSVGVIKRDFGKILACGTYGWWFDQHFGGGRFNHPEIIKVFNKQQKIAKMMASLPKKQNEIAFIYDEESISYISNQSSKECIEYFRNYEVARIGAGVDYYFHNDMSNENMPDYKLYVFFNTFALSQKEKEDIKEKLTKNHATAIWVYASGVIDLEENSFSEKNIKELVGIDIERKDVFQSGKYRFNNKADNFIRIDDKKEIYGDIVRPIHGNILTIIDDRKTFNAPVFVPSEQDSIVIANYLNTGLPAVAVKDTGKYISVFHGSKVLSSKFVREIALFAGCHIYSDSEDVIYTDGNTLTIHASNKGEKKILLKTPSTIIDLYTDEVLGTNTKCWDAYLEKGQTMTILIEDSNNEKS